MKAWIFIAALLLAAPATAAAQGTIGAGLSFLSDEGTGVGVTFDYSRPFRQLSNNRALGWVADISYHRDSDDEFGVDISASILTVQGGVRVSGPLGQDEKLTWHAQGLVGILRASASVEGIVGDVCDLVDVDCSDSDSRFVVTPGAGINYTLNPRTAIRAQIDLPFGDDVSAVRFWFGVAIKTRD